MFDHHQRSCRLSGLALLLAGLLYLVGTVAEPLLHAYAAQGQGSAVERVDSTGHESDDPDPTGSHDDSQCLLCKVAAPIVAPATGPVVAYELDDARSVFLVPGRSRAPPACASPQPRAPPFA